MSCTPFVERLATDRRPELLDPAIREWMMRGDRLLFLMQLSIEPVLATIRDEPAPIAGGGSGSRSGRGGPSR